MQESIERRYEEDEIDLKELFKTIWDNRVFILVFTSIVTTLAIIYSFVVTPIYEAKAIVKIGEYKNSNSRAKIDNSSALATELKVLYIDLLKNNKEKLAKIEDISVLKGQKDFLSITANSISNDLASKEIQKVINYIRTKHQKILDEVIENKKLQLKSLEKKIDFIKNTKLVELEEKIIYQEKIVLSSLLSKLKLTQQNIKDFQKQLDITEKNLSKIKSSNSTLAAINIMEKRNIEEKINRLKLEYIDLQKEKENLLLNTLPSLKRNKQNIIKTELEILEEEKKILETSMLPYNYKNSEVVGEIILNDYPIKPKKTLIVIVSFVTAFILSIFLVFFIKFVKEMRD